MKKIKLVTWIALFSLVVGITSPKLSKAGDISPAESSLDAPLEGAASIFLPIVSQSCPAPYGLPGEPNPPFPYTGYNPPGFLSYDEVNYHVDEQNLHCRPVTIAWEKSADVDEEQRLEVTAFYIAKFIESWEIFQGFVYPSYTVVLKTQSDYAIGEFGIGYEGIADNYTHSYLERVAHEVFHAWVGNALKDDQDQKYDDGLWFREGITQYYGERGAGITDYTDDMIRIWNTYQDSILGTQYDIPLTDMPSEALATGDETFSLNVYWKGALVAYLMDQRLIANGLNLDVFLREMYREYALNQRSFKTPEAIAMLNAITGEDWTDFFDHYIYGVTPLPLDGEFDYLPR